MALWFQLNINDKVVGTFEAQRQPADDLSIDQTQPDVVNTYTIRVDGREIGTVLHRFGDGAWALVHRGLRLVADRGFNQVKGEP